MVQQFMRGAKPSPRHKLLAAVPHLALVAPPPQFAVVPKQLSMWDNDRDGDCVTAEEAFAKAWWSTYCGLPELFIPVAEVVRWASKYGFLNGAMLTDVMDVMKGDGFTVGGQNFKIGGYSGVDYSNQTTLQSALTVGPVKIAIDADALPQGAGNQQGWFDVNNRRYTNTDHCVSLSGYGSAGYLFQQLGVSVPNGLAASTPGYLLFTWSTIGFVTHDWLTGTCTEAWVRNPTTPGQSPAPAPIPPTPGPGPGPGPAPIPPAPVGKMNLQLSLSLTPPHSLTGTYTLSPAAGQPAGISFTGVWQFIVKYYHVLEPYLAEYGKVIIPIITADLLAGKAYPQILLDIAEALAAEGVQVPAAA